MRPSDGKPPPPRKVQPKPTGTGPMQPFARCLEQDCPWKPDPGKGYQAQAEAHTKQGHATEAGWRREGEEPK